MKFLIIAFLSALLVTSACGKKQKKDRVEPPGKPTPRTLQASASIEIELEEEGVNKQDNLIYTKSLDSSKATAQKMSDCTLGDVTLSQKETLKYVDGVDQKNKQILSLKKGNGNNDLIPEVESFFVEKLEKPDAIPYGRWIAKRGKKEELLKNYRVEISESSILIELGCEKPNPAYKE